MNTNIATISNERHIHSIEYYANSSMNTLSTESNIHSSILSTIGNTPVVKINSLAPDHVQIFVKVESFNPLGSVKDRLALGIIEAAERDGSLKPGQTVVEATSGNTGIGLAMVCAQKGYPLVVTMAENFSVERRRLIRYLGAKVILTPASEKGTGMLAKAVELADEHGWFLCRQFANEANADIHSKTTAREIIRDFPNGSLDYFVTGFGTGGTLKGISRVLRDESPATSIVAAEPDNAQVVSSGVRQQYTSMGNPIGSHSVFRPHIMQGWSPDFISKLTDDVIEQGLIDRLVPVSGNDSIRLAQQLARREGIFCGISSGATLAAALEVAKTAAPGSTLLCMLPDTGERYLSTPLFANIAESMTDEELSISTSTSGYRFDQPTPKPKDDANNGPQKQEIPSVAAQEFISETIESKQHPIAIFSLEWCEFCWSVGKLFKLMGVDYRSIDLDSVDYQQDDWGGQVRTALKFATDAPTIPQIFIGGKHLGGCTDVFDAFESGELQLLLSAQGIHWNANVSIDPYSLLPSWLHPR